jgi:hypothetical protein
LAQRCFEAAITRDPQDLAFRFNIPWQHGRGKKGHILAVAKFDHLLKIGGSTASARTLANSYLFLVPAATENCALHIAPLGPKVDDD